MNSLPVLTRPDRLARRNGGWWRDDLAVGVRVMNTNHPDSRHELWVVLHRVPNIP